MTVLQFPGQTLNPIPANPGPVGDDEFSLWQKIAQRLYSKSQNPTPPVPPASILVSWEADDGVTSGTLGQPVSAWVSGSDTLAQATAGNRPSNENYFVAGRGVEFDGVDDYLSISPNPITGGVGSLAMVFETGVLSGAHVLLEAFDSGASTSSDLLVNFGTPSRLTLVRSGPGGTAQHVCDTTAILDNTRYQVLVTFNGITPRIWINRTEQSLTLTGTPQALWFNGGDLYVGATFAPSNFFIGAIGVTRFYDAILGTAARAALFDELDTDWIGVFPPAFVLEDGTSYFLLEDGTSRILIES